MDISRELQNLSIKEQRFIFFEYPLRNPIKGKKTKKITAPVVYPLLWVGNSPRYVYGAGEKIAGGAIDIVWDAIPKELLYHGLKGAWNDSEVLLQPLKEIGSTMAKVRDDFRNSGINLTAAGVEKVPEMVKNVILDSMIGTIRLGIEAVYHPVRILFSPKKSVQDLLKIVGHILGDPRQITDLVRMQDSSTRRFRGGASGAVREILAGLMKILTSPTGNMENWVWGAGATPPAAPAVAPVTTPAAPVAAPPPTPPLNRAPSADYPNGWYQLLGDGTAIPYQWAWYLKPGGNATATRPAQPPIPQARPAPPPPATAPTTPPPPTSPFLSLTEISHPNGWYQLLGDGTRNPFIWVWSPKPGGDPSVPLPTPPPLPTP